MMTASFPHPPRGLKALPWKLPILIYRSGLGWIMGTKFLLLEHIGRRTGQLRRAVLEVIDLDPVEGEYVVASGFGTRSQWFQNISQEPRVTIQVGSKRIDALASRLDPDQAGELLLRYAERHPGNLKALGALLGYEIDHSPEGIRAFGRELPLVRFEPREGQQGSA